jgi:hypothetical protein
LSLTAHVFECSLIYRGTFESLAGIKSTYLPSINQILKTSQEELIENCTETTIGTYMEATALMIYMSYYLIDAMSCLKSILTNTINIGYCNSLDIQPISKKERRT